MTIYVGLAQRYCEYCTYSNADCKYSLILTGGTELEDVSVNSEGKPNMSRKLRIIC